MGEIYNRAKKYVERKNKIDKFKFPKFINSIRKANLAVDIRRDITEFMDNHISIIDLVDIIYIAHITNPFPGITVLNTNIDDQYYLKILVDFTCGNSYNIENAHSIGLYIFPKNRTNDTLSRSVYKYIMFIRGNKLVRIILDDSIDNVYMTEIINYQNPLERMHVSKYNIGHFKNNKYNDTYIDKIDLLKVLVDIVVKSIISDTKETNNDTDISRI